ncbi:cell wall-binding repeat-containing protein [Herbiconiux sp. 11R-BC]|uniref:cell wall-binding repeat-containing protein n=1 Tax=Herbiconiux sp. 11R-BC TaxID=3111637 RepID=UPI003C103E77
MPERPLREYGTLMSNRHIRSEVMMSDKRPRGTSLGARLAMVVAAVSFGVLLAPTAAHASVLVANDDYSLFADETFTSPPGGGIFANDTGFDPGGRFGVSASRPAHGELVIRSLSDGGITYAPDPGFVGIDTFTYCVTSTSSTSCASASATVTLHVTATVERIGGADRYAVSAAVSAAKFPSGVATVFVASGEVFPDALSASGAAGAIGAPVLLVSKNAIPDVVEAELSRLHPRNIVLLGGTDTIAVTVERALQNHVDPGMVKRISGADRYAVSAGISEQAFPAAPPGPSVAYVASGEVFADALSGSAAAGLLGAPVLLTAKGVLPPVVSAELARLAPTKIVILGGTDSISPAVEAELQARAITTRFSGADRFAVSAAVSAGAFDPSKAHVVFVASGAVFPDALSGSAAAIRVGAPVLLVTRDDVPALVAAELDRVKPSRIVVLGGPLTVSDATIAALRSHLAQ